MVTKKNECEEIIYEKCLMATLLYNEDITKDHYRYVIEHVPAKMIYNTDCKKLYEVIVNTYDTVDEGLLGTDLYRDTVEKLFDMETDYKSIFAIEDLEEYWYPKSTYKHWIKEVQSAYYTEAFRLAETEEEYQNILEEQQRLCSDTEMQQLSENVTIIEDYERTKGTSIITPWKSVNSLIGSMQGGDMIVLAGSTGCGKTCFMLNLAIGIAKQGKTVDIFSLEMPKRQLVQRIACSQTGVDAKKFRNFTLTNTDIKKLRAYLDSGFKALNINVYPKQKVSISEIERIEKSSKSDIIFIDYLGLIEGDKRLGRYDRFSEISRTIKLMAMVTNKPVIALHQLNREFMQRDNKEPQLSDLRESGQIEQDSDMVWFVYRPGLFDSNVGTSLMKFKVAKNRHGERGDVEMTMNGDTQRIIDNNVVRRDSDAKVCFISKTSNKEESFKNDNDKDREKVVTAV
jgi:replicative DNA helicase